MVKTAQLQLIVRLRILATNEIPISSAVLGVMITPAVIISASGVSNEEKPEILKAYLDRFKLTVRSYFPVPAGSGPGAFIDLAERYPVFELLASYGVQLTKSSGGS